MIIEALIGGVTVCYVASLSFAKWCVKHETERDPVAARLADIRFRKKQLEILFSDIRETRIDGSLLHAQRMEQRNQKDRRLDELSTKLEELSQLQAKILRGEA